jgi:WD40 repeat protein
MIATGGKDDIFLWDARTGGRLNPPLKGHRGGILGLAFSPDGSLLASSGKDKTIRVWRTGDHQLERPPRTIPEAVRNLVISPDGRLIAASRGTSIYLWDFPSLSFRGEVSRAAKSFISDLAFNRNGHLVSASSDAQITLWDVAQRTSIGTFKAGQAQVLGLAAHPSRDILATAGSDFKVRLWNIWTGKELGPPPEGHHDAVVSVAFSRDGNTLASAGRDKEVLLWDVSHGQWDLSSGRPSVALLGHGQTVWTVAFGESGDLVSGGDDDAAILWHLPAKPRFARRPNGLAGEADSVAFNKTGDLLAVGGMDGAIHLWDTVAQRPRELTLKAHRGPVNGLVFRAQTLISGGADGRVLLWDLDHPDNEPQELNLPAGSAPHGIWSLALSPDQKIVAAGDDQGSVRLWSLDSFSEK